MTAPKHVMLCQHTHFTQQDWSPVFPSTRMKYETEIQRVFQQGPETFLPTERCHAGGIRNIASKTHRVRIFLRTRAPPLQMMEQRKCAVL